MNMTTIVQQDIDRIVACTYIPWNRLIGKTVMVTGATGFIGCLLVRALSVFSERNNYSVKILAVVRNEQKAISLFQKEIDSGIVTLVIGDVTIPISCKDRADYVVHCASNASPDKYMENPVGTMRTNFDGTLNLLEYSKKVHADKFLYVSTIEVYGRTSQLEMIGEEDFGYISTTNIRSCYPESKKCCENLVQCFGSQYDLPVSIGRLSYIYGAGMSENDGKVCAMFARSVAAGKDVVLKSKGQQRRSYTYVSDAITGLLMVLLSGKNGEAYNIASRNSVITIAEMACKSCQLFPHQNVSVRFELPKETEKKAFTFIADAVLNAERLEALGWQAEVAIEDGLRYAVLDNMEKHKKKG